jgi:RNA polymerase sigma-70 factor (ECF subfamily)
VEEIDAEWLTLARQGDPDAFTQIVEHYQKPVFNLCYRMLGDPGEAEDAAQETFLRVYRSIRRYDESRTFTTWLLSIAAHYCIDQIRKQRMNLISMEDMNFVEPSDETPGPESALSRSEEQKRIRGLLNNLHPVDRAAVVMYYWYDFSYDEISQALSLSNSAVKSRLHRARQEMTQAWMDQNPQAYSVERSPHGKRSPAF